VSLLLIPNWKKAGNSYDNIEYLKVEAEFMENARNQLSVTDVKVENFHGKLPELTPPERNYMHGLSMSADNLDLMKNHVVLQNSDRQHLQLDSNTKVVDYAKLYQETFASSPPQRRVHNLFLRLSFRLGTKQNCLYSARWRIFTSASQKVR
jgi:hypothetical protein